MRFEFKGPEDLEVGMCYTMRWDDQELIFRHEGRCFDGKNLDEDRVQASYWLQTSKREFKKKGSYQTTPYITRRGLRRSTVTEEVWLDECVRLDKWMTLEEAEKTFEQKLKTVL
jgi:hypothetical protein